MNAGALGAGAEKEPIEGGAGVSVSKEYGGGAGAGAATAVATAVVDEGLAVLEVLDVVAAAGKYGLWNTGG